MQHSSSEPSILPLLSIIHFRVQDYTTQAYRIFQETNLGQMPPKFIFQTAGKAYKSTPENAQLSNIFSDLMVDLATKDFQPPSDPQAIKADAQLNKSILERSWRVCKHSSFGNLSMKGKTHEEFLVGWAKLEKFCKKLEGLGKQVDKAQWDELMDDIGEILGDIGDADAEN